MKKYLIGLIFLLVSSVGFAHEMTPTYPVLKPSYMDGLLVTTMEIFNKRQDIEYYEIAVFDKDWNPIPFVSSYKVFKLEYQKRISFDIYLREKDKDAAVYVCTRSKALKKNVSNTNVVSTICSKFKRK
jgi:hypothetical protein